MVHRWCRWWDATKLDGIIAVSNAWEVTGFTYLPLVPFQPHSFVVDSFYQLRATISQQPTWFLEVSGSTLIDHVWLPVYLGGTVDEWMIEASLRKTGITGYFGNRGSSYPQLTSTSFALNILLFGRVLPEVSQHLRCPCFALLSPLMLVYHL